MKKGQLLPDYFIKTLIVCFAVAYNPVTCCIKPHVLLHQ